MSRIWFETKVSTTFLQQGCEASGRARDDRLHCQRLMELEVEGLTGAAHGERSPDRINQRIEADGDTDPRSI